MNQPLAYIHPDAKIAKNVVIEPFVTIAKNVTIQEGTWIGANASILEGARIGKNCQIHQGAVISGVPQDLKFKGEATTAEIGDNTTIREFVTINRGTKSRGKTAIGSNSLLMAYVHVAHDCIIGNNCIIVNSVGISGEVVIDDWAIIGGMTAIHQFVRIGKHAMVSGGSLVRKDIPPYIKAAREPTAFAGINSVGLRRRNFTSEQIREIQEVYRYIYQRGYNNTKALQIIETEVPASTERDEILMFIRNAERGIIKGYND